MSAAGAEPAAQPGKDPTEAPGQAGGEAIQSEGRAEKKRQPKRGWVGTSQSQPPRRRGRPRLHPVVLGLGSNIEPRLHLPQAVELLEQQVKIDCLSRAWETPAVGQPGAPDFINAAVMARTKLSPAELKAQVIRPIEARLGRVRGADKNAPRTIDIDILMYDGEILDPQVWEQAYLAVPVAELVPGYANSVSGERLADAAVRLARMTRFQPRPAVLPGPWQEGAD